jgi:hypothetical protein
VAASSDTPLRGSLALLLPPLPLLPLPAPPKSDLKKDCMATGDAHATPRLRGRCDGGATRAGAAAVRAARRDAARASGACGTRADMRGTAGAGGGGELLLLRCAGAALRFGGACGNERTVASTCSTPSRISDNPQRAFPWPCPLAPARRACHGARHAAGAGAAHAHRPVVRG